MTNANLQGAQLAYCNLSNCNFTNANFNAVDLSNVNLDLAFNVDPFLLESASKSKAGPISLSISNDHPIAASNDVVNRHTIINKLEKQFKSAKYSNNSNSGSLERQANFTDPRYEEMVIDGSNPLFGEIEISGSKKFCISPCMCIIAYS